MTLFITDAPDDFNVVFRVRNIQRGIDIEVIFILTRIPELDLFAGIIAEAFGPGQDDVVGKGADESLTLFFRCAFVITTKREAGDRADVGCLQENAPECGLFFRHGAFAEHDLFHDLVGQLFCKRARRGGLFRPCARGSEQSENQQT